jgi:hypothetical protein
MDDKELTKVIYAIIGLILSIGFFIFMEVI